MFDLRYHVASLAAVFFALVIGILVGVALASHGLGDAERKQLHRDLRDAQDQVNALKAEVTKSAADRSFVEKTYPAVMANRLRGKRIAVLFVGSVDGDTRAAINKTLADAGSRLPIRLRAIKVPIDPVALDKQLARRPFLAAFAGPDKLDDLGRELGRELVAGGDAPAWTSLEGQIVEERSGQSKQPADGVVVVRTAASQSGDTASFLRGIYAGLGEIPGIAAVGVETTTAAESAIPVYQRVGLSSVDDVNDPVGRLGLALLLADSGVTGAYGTKASADGVLPETVPPVTTPGG